MGQNFLTDTNLLRAVAADAGITENDTVLEIGAGAGALTAELCAKAKYVIAYEIDLRLKEVLAERLAGFDNYELIFKDYLKEKEPRFFDKVCANLPYYITAPVIFRLIESPEPSKTMVFMVQEEVAERLCATPGGKEYGAMTASANLAYRAEITRRVTRTMFIPRPNVDSAVVRLSYIEGADNILNQKTRKVIRAAFAMRRKTLLNNLSAGLNLTKDDAQKVLEACGISPSARGETLSAAEFLQLTRKLSEFGVWNCG